MLHGFASDAGTAGTLSLANALFDLKLLTPRVN
jgi:hypothetical protein